MEIRDGPDGPDGPVQYVSYCGRHCKPQPQLSGARLVSEMEEAGELPEQLAPSTLDNAQPYQLPAKVRLQGGWLHPGGGSAAGSRQRQPASRAAMAARSVQCCVPGVRWRW